MAQRAFEAQKNFEAQNSFGHGKARSGLGLAFLVLCTLLTLALMSKVDQRVSALMSPQSPLLPLSDDKGFPPARSVEFVPGAAPDRPGSLWRTRLGAGLIVLGGLLVIGGLVLITDTGAPTTPGPPGEPGGRAR